MNKVPKTICLWCNSAFDNRPNSGKCPNCGHTNFLDCEIVMTYPSDEDKSVMLKLGNLSTLESMRNGELWFQSPKYYQTYAGNPAVCDVEECAYDYISEIPEDKIKAVIPLNIEVNLIVCSGKTYRIGALKSAKYYELSQKQNYYRILCFFRLNANNGILDKRDDRLKYFGTHFCLIDINKLNQKMEIYAQKNNLTFWPTDVKYASKAYQGEYNPTFKKDTYAYQCEYRYILRGEKLNDLAEKEPKIIKLSGMDEMMSEPRPLNKLLEVQKLDELLDLFRKEE